MKLVVPIVNRTNYSKLRPIIELLSNSNQLDIDIIISSGALIGDYGTVRKDIEEDNFGKVIYMDTCLKSDRWEAMSKNIALSMIQYSMYLKSNDNICAVLIVGDRFDMLGFAISSAIQNIPIFHLQGGEKSGTIDDKIRYAITMLSDYHFPATRLSSINIGKCGIAKHKIFFYGCPAVEHTVGLHDGSKLNIDALKKYSKRNIEIRESEDYILVQVHPNTTDLGDVNMVDLLTALNKINLKSIIMYPNIDATNHEIINAMRTMRNYNNFYYYKHFNIRTFVNVLANAKCFIGNSSSLIRESASFGVPAINLGTRQNNRECNDNVFHCKFNADEIIRCYENIKNIKFEKNNLYFKKNCAKNISNKILEITNEKRN